MPTAIPRLPRPALPLALAVCAALLAACDPVYRVGARQALVGPVPSTDSVPAALAIDVPATGDCLEAALRAMPSVNDVRRSKQPRYRRMVEAHMVFAVADPSVPGPREFANLELEAENGRVPVLTVSWLSMGFGGPPLDEQRRKIAVATDVLAALRDACVPQAIGEIHCVSEGAARSAACTAP